MCRDGGLYGFVLVDGRWIDGWDIVHGLCRDAGTLTDADCTSYSLKQSRIVEYATREQAQQAVNTLSNQNLMGRLVYVREVSCTSTLSKGPRGVRSDTVLSCKSQC